MQSSIAHGCIPAAERIAFCKLSIVSRVSRIQHTPHAVRCSKSIVDRIVTLVKPEVKEDGLILVGDCRLSWSADAELKVNTEECAEGTCYLLDFTLREGEKEFKVVME